VHIKSDCEGWRLVLLNSGNTRFQRSGEKLSGLERRILNDYQKDFPLDSSPYATIAAQNGVDETTVIQTIKKLKDSGYISRVGAVFRANTIGVSTLAAMTVLASEIDKVATIINQYDEVNHNYLRDHHFNLWFVAAACDEDRLNDVLDDIEDRTGIAVMYLPMIEDYHIDLGFEIKWT
jgi:DNA-binding Lrp family transcriptional regulator